MFGFLKDKLKSVVDKFSKKVEEEGKEEFAQDEMSKSAEKRGTAQSIESQKTEKSKEKPKTEVKTSKSKEERKPSKKEEKHNKKEKKAKHEKPEHKKESEEVKEEVEELETEQSEKEPIPEITEEIPTESTEEVKQEIEILEKETIEEKTEKKGFFSKLFGKKKADEFDQTEKSSHAAERVDAQSSEIQTKIEEEIKSSEKPLEESVAEELESENEKAVEEADEEFAQPRAILSEREREASQRSEKLTASEEQKNKLRSKGETNEEEKKGFLSFIKEKVTTKKIDEKQFEELFWELELALLESNVAVEVIEKIKDDLKEKLVNQPIKKSEINNIITNSLKESIENLFDIPTFNLLQRIKEKKPLVICFIGINGSGKTTTIAKVAHLLQKNKISCVMAAADTFRAAAIQQLEEHANNLNIKIIKHDYGADSAAVAFDAVKHAEARHIDAVLIDTAGRLHSNEDLMKEMQKLVRVAKPDLKIFIGESITGNDCVEQAKKFNELIGIDAIILSKADIDDKGGAAISVSYITKKPILYLGTGQTYDDLKEFNKEDIIKSLGL